MPSSTRKRTPTDQAQWSDRWWTSADGLRLHARDYAGASGEARQAVLCIHGLTRNARDFDSLAPQIAGWGRRVLVVDVRGRGLSDRDPVSANYQPAVYAADVALLLDRLGIRQVQVIGTSMGGLISMVLAVTRADLLGGIILNDVGPVLAAEGLSRIAGYVGRAAPVRSWREAAAYARTMNEHAFPAYDARDWTRMARRLFREGEDGAPQLDYDPAIAEPIRAAAAQPAPDLWPLYTALVTGRPATIIRGARSDLLDAATVARMRQVAPHAAAVEAPGVGHAPMLDEPEALAAIQAHLERAP